MNAERLSGKFSAIAPAVVARDDGLGSVPASPALFKTKWEAALWKQQGREWKGFARTVKRDAL